MDKVKNNPIIKKIGFNKIVLCLVIIIMYGIFAMLSDSFVSYPRIISALNYAYFLGFLALGVTFVIGTGGIDFSIGPVMFCCAIVSGQLLVHHGYSLPLSLLIAILIGVIFGSFNGFMVSYCRIPPFIISMASMQISKGVASLFTKTQNVSWPQSMNENGWFRNLVKYRLVGDTPRDVTIIPTGLICLLVVAIICAIILNKTRTGRYILCIGSNKEAVRLSGVNVRKYQMLAYVICGVLVGIASIFFVGAYTTVQPGMGDQYNNEAIAGAVMGGTSMAGGVASVGGTIIGVMIIALLQEGILAIGLTKDYQLVVTGLIVIVAVAIDIVSRRKKN